MSGPCLCGDPECQRCFPSARESVGHYEPCTTCKATGRDAMFPDEPCLACGGEGSVWIETAETL
jgi:hypothetical protein